MTSLLRDRPATTPEMLAAFGDAAHLRAALDFEAALARAEAAEGLIGADAAARIRAVCAAFTCDPAALADAAAHAGTLAIPLVERLRARLAQDSPEAANALHRGATSQDVADTALMLQARHGVAILRGRARAISDALARLAEQHAATPMIGRTLMQAALPISFGLKAAGWKLGVDAALARLEREAGTALALQLGGPAGTMGGLTRGVAERMADDLGLAAPALPWHARREAIAGLAAALGVLVGAVGKIALDVALMAQSEVGEAFEPRQPGRGGSSAMAHKRNPTGCQVALSAAARAPGLVAAILSGLPQQHERGLGGWQAEGPVLAELFLIADGALAAMAAVAEGLEVDSAAMARNLSAADVGDDIGLSVELVARALDLGREEG